MPANVVKTKRDERLWDEAKKEAPPKGKSWAYTMATFLRMRDRKGGKRNRKMKKEGSLLGYQKTAGLLGNLKKRGRSMISGVGKAISSAEAHRKRTDQFLAGKTNKHPYHKPLGGVKIGKP